MVAEPVQEGVRFWEWTKIVDEYTELKLSVQEDRLIALAGLAYARSLSADYIAGIWADNIHNELLWRVTDPGHRPDIAPTWSWASTTAWVHKADERGDFEVLSTVKDSEDDAFKAFRFMAAITIRAYLTKIIIQRVPCPEPQYSEYYIRPRYTSSSVQFTLVNIHWDTFDPSFYNGGTGFGSALPTDETQAHKYTLFLKSAIQRILLIRQS